MSSPIVAPNDHARHTAEAGACLSSPDAPATPDTTPVNYAVDIVRFTVVREAAVTTTLSDPAAVAMLARDLIPDDAREHFGLLSQ